MVICLIDSDIIHKATRSAKNIFKFFGSINHKSLFQNLQAICHHKAQVAAHNNISHKIQEIASIFES